MQKIGMWNVQRLVATRENNYNKENKIKLLAIQNNNDDDNKEID